MAQKPSSTCPFCGYVTTTEYRIMYHIEEHHAEGPSPFVAESISDRETAGNARKTTADDSEATTSNQHELLDYVYCPLERCGEVVPVIELDEHLELHSAEASASHKEPEPVPKVPFSSEGSRPKAADNHQAPLNKQEYAKRSWKAIFSNTGTKTPAGNNGTGDTKEKPQNYASSLLSRAQIPIFKKSGLGPHSHERQMPDRIRTLLESDGIPKSVNTLDENGSLIKKDVFENRGVGIIRILERLLEKDESTEYAYTCHHSVVHTSKLKGEGGFCGYRNIQMLCSYIISTESQGYPHFNRKIPTIFEIQDYIEEAWDNGINASGRLETGGIRGTRKYIGTPEAQAMMIHLNISCQAQGLKSKGSQPAFEHLFEIVEQYFYRSCTNSNKIRSTEMPPLYLQQPGHSVTIVGFEKRLDGSKNLLVFDPMFHDNPELSQYARRVLPNRKLSDLLLPYRRGAKYLRKHSEFELLRLTPPITRA